MAVFRDVITTDGEVLIAKMLSGQCEIRFTKMEWGDGTLGSGEDARNVKELKHKITSSSAMTVTRDNQIVYVSAEFTNQELSDGMYLREKGIFASDGVKEILMIYANNGSLAEYIAPAIEGLIEKTMRSIMTFSQSDNINVELKSEVFTYKDDFEKHLRDNDNPHQIEYELPKELAELQNKEKMSITFGKIAKAVKAFINHYTQKATASILGHVKLSNSAAITKTGEYALDATEKNATIDGTLAHLIASQNNDFANQIQQLLTNMTVVKSDITYADGFEHGGNWGPNKLGSLLASYGKLKILKLNCKPIDDLAKNTWYPIILELQPLCTCTDLINMCSAGRLMLNGNSHLYLFTNDVIPSGTWITGTFIFLS